MTESIQQYITKDMTIGDIIQKYPAAAEVFLHFGLHCVGCHISPVETLEQGALAHGMTPELVTEMLTEANKVIHATGGKVAVQEKQSAERSITVTEAAANKVLEILKKEEKEGYVLRIKVVPGGCSGMSYNFLVEEKPEEGDFIVEKNGLKVVVDQASLDVMGGSNIDYVETLQESGFKVENPNAQKKCGCGSSFS